MAEIAIRKAHDEDDYSEIEHLMQILNQPFNVHPAIEHYACHSPIWLQQIEVSCSS